MKKLGLRALRSLRLCKDFQLIKKELKSRICEL